MNKGRVGEDRGSKETDIPPQSSARDGIRMYKGQLDHGKDWVEDRLQ
jgi:hypothetical protein